VAERSKKRRERIVPLGTQIVTRVDTHTPEGSVLQMAGAVAVILQMPVNSTGELKAIAKGCITRYHSHHYLGFAETEWKLLNKESPTRIKPLLYVYRVLLTGIHMMRTGEVEANLHTLNSFFKLPYIPGLIALKLGASEKGTIQDADMAFHQKEYERLRSVLEQASLESKLPERATGSEALNELLIRIRLHSTTGSGF
jgi:predicted nucleotidyltransferase